MGKEQDYNPLVHADANPVLVFNFGLKANESHNAPYSLTNRKVERCQGNEN
jgi:hypothetical protein